MEFVPLEYLLRELWLFMPAQPLLRRFILIVCPHRAKMLEQLVRQVAQVIGVCQVFHLQLTVVMVNVRAVAWLIL